MTGQVVKANGFEFDLSTLTEAERDRLPQVIVEVARSPKITEEMNQWMRTHCITMIVKWPYRISPQDPDSYSRLAKTRDGRPILAIFRALFEALVPVYPDRDVRRTVERQVRKWPNQ
jgi:hypothetical protein